MKELFPCDSMMIFVLFVVLLGSSSALWNGEVPDRYSHPWAAVVRTENMYNRNCSGTLIDRRWVLTNAHCVDNGGSRSEGYAILGAHDLRDASEGGRQTIEVAESYMHPKYDQFTLEFDIALIRLAQPAMVGQKTISVAEALTNEHDFETIFEQSRQCYVYGFGPDTNQNGIWSKGQIGQYIGRILIRMFLCNRQFDLFNWTYSEDQICYKPSLPRTGMCFGDDGGPVVCRHRGKWALTAVNTFYSTLGGYCRGRFIGGIIVHESIPFIKNVTGLEFTGI